MPYHCPPSSHARVKPRVQPCHTRQPFERRPPEQVRQGRNDRRSAGSTSEQEVARNLVFPRWWLQDGDVAIRIARIAVCCVLRCCASSAAGAAHGHGAQHTQTNADQRAPHVPLTHARARATWRRWKVVRGWFLAEQEESVQSPVLSGVVGPVQVRTPFTSGAQFV